MTRRKHRALTMFLALALMFACAPLTAPTTIPPTFDPGSLNTMIAQTAGAAATQTALLQPPTITPTYTPFPTNTPTEIPSPTPTFIFILPTATVPSDTPTPYVSKSGDTYSCQIVAQSPANNASFASGANFDANWRVENSGSSIWDANSADYRFLSGDKLHKSNIYDFPKTTAPGEQVDLTVNMKAPKDAGTYSTTWEIRIGKTEFCKMKLTIVVK